MATNERVQGTEQSGTRPGQLGTTPPQPARSNSEREGRMARGRQSGSKADRNERQPSQRKNVNAEQLARGLGWFSIGLGLAEVVAPHGIARLVGVRGDHRALIRALGLREISHGIGILTQSRPAKAVWSRAGGDVIDLACLSVAYSSPKAKRDRVATATAAVAGMAVLDLYCARQLSRGSESGVIQVQKSIIVNRSPEEVYRFWRDLQNLPRFMYYLESIQMTGANRSHWVTRGPAGTRFEWDAEITEDRPNQMMAWRSLEGSDMGTSGSVRFERAPGGRGTVVKLDARYAPPGGVIGAALAKLFGEDPELELREDLRRFKQVIETGEVMTIEGQPAGRASSTSWRYDRPMRSRDVAPEPSRGRSATSR